MATLDSWVEIPPYATPVAPKEPETNVTQATVAPPPSPGKAKQPETSSGHGRSASTSSSLTGHFTNAIMSAALNVPAPATPSDPRKTAGRLLSTRDSLSIPITAVNFRRFVSKSGAVFWLQDRIEEVIFWRKGWKVTVAWMMAYSFLCYYPRLILLLPHVLLLTILFVTYNIQGSSEDKEETPWRPTEAREGSAEWFANLQAIQNLMGFYADVYEEVVPLLPHITHTAPTSSSLFTFLVISLLVTLPALPLLPLRPTFLVIGLAPFILTHPTIQRVVPTVINAGRRIYFTTLQRIVDNDKLDDVVWSSPLKEVELWENERFSIPGTSGDSGWSKANLRRGERKGWSRRRDGWSDASALDGNMEGELRNLTFTLEPGWHFVMTEDWRPDLSGSWVAEIGADRDGWVYTNDVWNEPRVEPPEEWKLRGMTRRRRWTRRVYFVEPTKQG